MIKLSKIYEALQFVSMDSSVYYLIDVDDIFIYNQFVSDESFLDELEEHEYIHMPSLYDINEKDMMINYAYTLRGSLRDKLLDVFNRKGAFSNFKNILRNNGTINDWYKYRDKCYLKLAKKILEENDLDYINDMEENLCEICHKYEATMVLDGKKVCENCIQDEDDFNCPNDITLYIDGKSYKFNLSLLRSNKCFIWNARSSKYEYEVSMRSSLDCELRTEFDRFVEKIKDEVECKSIYRGFLKLKGNIYISYDGFIIDGKKYSPNEFFKLVSCYEGWVLEYDINDQSSHHLGKDEYFIKEVITSETILIKCDEFISKYNEYSGDEDMLYFSVITDFVEIIKRILVLKNHEVDIDYICDNVVSKMDDFKFKEWSRSCLSMLEKVKDYE